MQFGGIMINIACNSLYVHIPTGLLIISGKAQDRS